VDGTIGLAAETLTISAGTGSVTFSAAVGSGNPTMLTTLTVTSCATLNFNAAVDLTGAVAVTNSGVLTKNNVGAITASGGFSATGAVNLASNISTTNTALSIGGNLVLAQGAALTLNSGAGAGSITLSGTVDGTALGVAETLTLIAGTGIVTLGGAVGTGLPAMLTDVTVSSCGAMNVNAAVNLTGAFSVTNSGLLTKNAAGAITANGGFSATGAVSLASNVTTTNTLVSIGGPLTLAANSIIATGNGNVTFLSTIDGARTLTVSSTGLTTLTGIIGGGTQLLSLTSTLGSVTVLASITTSGPGGISLGITTINAASTLTPGTGTSTLQSLAVNGGNLTLGGPLSVTTNIVISAPRTLDDTAGAAITVGGNWTNSGTFTAGVGSVTATGACALTSGGSAFYNLTIGGPAGAVTPQDPLTVSRHFVINAGGTYFNNGQTLTLGGGAGVAGNLIDSNGGTQNLGTVQISTALKTMTTNILAGALTITLTGSLDLSGNALTAGPFTNNGTLFRTGTAGETAPKTNTFPGIVAYRTGAGTIQTYGSSLANKDYYILRIDSGIKQVNADLYVVDTLFIQGGTLTVPLNQKITIEGIFDTSGGTFNCGTGEVIFDDFSTSYPTSFVWGSTTFYDFTCTTPSKQIAFEQNVTQHIAPGGVFKLVAGVAAGRISLLAAGPPVPPPPPYAVFLNPGVNPPAPPPPPPMLAQQWGLDVPLTASINIDFVYVELGYATRILVPGSITFNVHDWSFNWRDIVPVFASYTEDYQTAYDPAGNGNGKVDRILVSTGGVILNDDFSSISVYVQGYNNNQPITGAANFSTGLNPNDDQFYILLPENSDVDTNATPRWGIITNNSLKAILGTNKIVISSPPPPPFGVGPGELPIDKAPPLFAYTLSVVGQNELFVRFSEPVVDNVGAMLTTARFSFPGNPIMIFTRISPAVGLGTQEALLTLANPVTATDQLAPTMLTVNNIWDMAIAPNAMPAAATTHRVSDIGLGLINDSLFEPLFAHDETQTGPFPGGIGLIQLGGFDGTKWLRRQDITLEGHIHDTVPPAYPLASNTRLWYDINIPSALKAPSGLWLPPFEDQTLLNGFSGLVPTDRNGDIQARQRIEINPPPANVQLRDFLIPSSDAKMVDGVLIEFYFKILAGGPIGQNLYTARVVNPAVAGWWLRVLPWEFAIHDLRMQRGGVQILKNVINPDKGEVTTLQFTQAKAGSVTVTVFDLSGSIIRVLARGNRSAGDYGITWDGTNRSGAKVTRGLYFIRIVGPGVDEIRKVLVVR
jgi:hypothetical protein